jgi:exopolysaccharide production protein ExoQ
MHLNVRSRPSSTLSTYPVFAATVFMMPPLCMLSPNALVILLLGHAVFSLWTLPWRMLLDGMPRPLVAALAAFLLLGLAGVGWSIVPDYSLPRVGQLLVLFAAGLVVVVSAAAVPGEQRLRLGLWLAAGMGVALIVPIIAWLSTLFYDASGTFFASVQTFGHFKRGAALLVLLSGPAAFSLHQRYGMQAAVALIAAVIACAVYVESGLSMVATVLGLTVGALALRFPRPTQIGVVICLAGLFAAAPLMRYAPNEVPQSVHEEIIGSPLLGRINSAVHRLLIWQFAAERAADHPILGWGLDSSRAIPGGHDNPRGYSERLPLHPHNAILQVWLELGAAGALIAAFAVVWSVLRIGPTFATKPAQAIALGMVTAMAVTALTAWSIWLSWWMAAIWLIVALMGATLSRRAKDDHLS